MVEAFIGGIMGKIAEILLDPVIQTTKNKIALSKASWKSLIQDLQKIAEEAEQQLVSEMKLLQEKVFNEHPEVEIHRWEIEKFFTASSQLAQISSAGTASIDCQWEKDAINQFFESFIDQNPEWLIYKTRGIIKLESFAKAYQTQMLHFIKNEDVNKVRLVKEKEAILPLINEGMTLWINVLAPNITWHFQQVQKDMFLPINQNTQSNVDYRSSIELTTKNVGLMLDQMMQKMIDRIS